MSRYLKYSVNADLVSKITKEFNADIIYTSLNIMFEVNDHFTDYEKYVCFDIDGEKQILSDLQDNSSALFNYIVPKELQQKNYEISLKLVSGETVYSNKIKIFFENNNLFNFVLQKISPSVFLDEGLISGLQWLNL